MSRSSYQYETSPRKYEPDYDIPRKRTQQTRRKNSTKKTTAKKQTIKTNYQIKKEKNFDCNWYIYHVTYSKF